jgi:hypothetical protein
MGFGVAAEPPPWGGGWRAATPSHGGSRAATPCPWGWLRATPDLWGGSQATPFSFLFFEKKKFEVFFLVFNFF